MKIHPEFKLNGYSYSKEALIDVAYSFIKEGEQFEISIGDFLLDWLNNSDLILVSTSGSTGKPKKIKLLKTHMVNSALATGSFFNLHEGNTALLCLPCTYIAGKMMLVRAMVLGLEIDYVQPNTKPLQKVTKSYDFAAMIPLQVQNSISQLDNIKTLLIGGAPVSLELKQALQNINTESFETYGMTETITHIAVKKIKSSKKPSFKIFPNISITTDKRNCLVIRAPTVTREQVVTNDLVTISNDGNYFTWLGRYDNIINSGGIKLIPEQIEIKLRTLIKTRFFVTGLPDKKLGKKLVLIVEGKINSDKLFQEIKQNKAIEKYEVPKEIYIVLSFVETENGKVNRIKTINLI